MRPVRAIPDHMIPDDARRIVMGPPEGSDPLADDGIRALEMLTYPTQHGQAYAAMVVLDPGDIERLASGEPIWVEFLGGVVPFDVHLA